MRTITSLTALLATCLLASACSSSQQATAAPAGQSAPTLTAAPEFTGIAHWLNSPPLRLSALRGKVVLVEFWTYSCINCIHVMPQLKQWHAAYRDQGLVIVGVHTPEYPEETATDKVQAAIERFGITYPVAQDNAYATWNAYCNRYWPALYLIDAQGRIAYHHIGEGRYAETEAMIRSLLEAASKNG